MYRKLLHSSILATSIFSLLLAPAATFAEPATSGTLTAADGKKVKVVHFEKMKVTDVKLKDAVAKAKDAVKEEKAKSNSETYDYILFDDQQIYTYEETPTSPDGELVVSDATTPAQTFSAMATSGQTDFIDDGVGGKQKISKVGSVGSYLSTVLKLPTGSSQVSDVSSSHHPYNYAGFEYTNTANSGIGSWQSDMGLQYYQNLGTSGTVSGWKPILTLKQKTGSDTWTAYQINFDSTYNQAQYHNGFKPGTSTTIYTYYNYNGKVRMKLTGTTVCGDMGCNSPGDASNTTIMESNAAWNISKIDDFKLLSTVVSSNNTGLNKAVYSSIKVDGVAVPSSYFLTPQQDHALVTRDSSNTVTIDVNSSLYPL